ncbi:DUF4129 domain-containing protein [Brevibacillus gelatini]|uniref:DUF4129 domain-containing protein n=1 Tax=Brevibacillus gelatini TaxID=1655277 RepID=A0A3M8AWR6_9BACL|nr:DUF4129 domain-containing protein [Brevibacillus gelatini]RNB55664.1 DUF4129 domain-containing protein [Brevibacillus gelatini]
MSFSLVGRWTLTFWLETLLVGASLMMLGWMTAGFGALLFFCLAGCLLLIAGSWLYHHGGRHTVLHLLLYPFVLGVGVLSFVLYGSWLIALALAGVFFWRIQGAAANGISHVSLLRRFVLAFMVCLLQLVVAALYGTAVHPDTFSPAPYFGMLALVTGSYVLIAIGAYLLREEALPIRLPARLRLLLAGQVLTTRLLLTVGYVAAASALLGILALLWSWVKGPLGTGLYMLIEPVLQQLTEWFSGLSQVLDKDQRVHHALNNDGQGGNLPLDPVSQGEPLFSLLEPYLIGIAVVVSLFLLGRYMWKRRNRQGQAEQKAAAPAMDLAPLPPSTEGEAAAEWDVSKWFQKPFGPTDDATRYAYFRFLQTMDKQGVTIHPHETTQEFLQRLQKHPALTAVQLELAGKITAFYEQYRYLERPLSQQELAEMQQAVQALVAYGQTSDPGG